MAFKTLNEKANGFMFYWKIKHFSLFSLLKESKIYSPAFRLEEIDKTEWSLSLLHKEGSEDNVVINIKRLEKDEGPISISVDIKLFLLKINGNKVVKTSENIDFKTSHWLTKPLTIERSALFEDETFFHPDETVTVGCFIKKHSENMPAFMECTAHTEVSAEKFLFDFPFDFSSCKFINQTIPRASVSKKYPNFKIILVPNHISQFITINIVMDTWGTDVYSKCQLSVEDSKNEILFLHKGCHTFLANSNDNSWCLISSVDPKREFLNFSTNSSLLLRCELVVSDGKVTSHVEECIYSFPTFQNIPNVAKNRSQMQKLKRMFDDSRLCDFTLRAGGSEFRIHKAVLGATSPVFCAMFEVEMKEKESSTSTINDIDADTLRKLINFAYTENVEDLEWESVVDLYAAADRFQIVELKQCCANWMVSNLKIENIPEVLQVSDMHEDSYLERGASDFMFAHAREIFRSENWNKFIESNLRVANKFMQETLIRLTENRLF